MQRMTATTELRVATCIKRENWHMKDPKYQDCVAVATIKRGRQNTLVVMSEKAKETTKKLVVLCSLRLRLMTVTTKTFPRTATNHTAEPKRVAKTTNHAGTSVGVILTL